MYFWDMIAVTLNWNWSLEPISPCTFTVVLCCVCLLETGV